MNSPNDQLNDPFEELTVSEYSRRYGIVENTVRTKINRKKLLTKKGFRDGRETILILVNPLMDHSIEDSEQSETIQGDYFEQPSSAFERSSESSNTAETLVSFMKETFSTVQNYSTQIVELSRENERYKLISEYSSKGVSQLEQENEQLKSKIYEQEARILELSLKEPSAVLEAKVLELETKIKADATNQAESKAKLEEEIATLKSRLEQEQKKSAFDKLLGR